MAKARLCVLTALAACLVFFSAQAQTNQTIYSSSLQNGWQNWSWATNNFSCTSPVLSNFSDSISVSCSSYTALYVEHTDFDSTLFSNLTFWLNGGPSGGQILTIVATLAGASQSSTVAVGPLASGSTWQQFTVSLADLGAADAPDLDGFWIFNNNNFTIPTFYVDDMVLTAGAPPGPNPTNFIGIDAAMNRTPISSMIYGLAWETDSNQLSDLNFTMNRSGGNEETTYNWQIGAHGKGADWYFECIADTPATPGASTDGVVANSKAAGAQALVTIPIIGWTPKLGPDRATLWSYSIAKYGPQTGNDPYQPDAGDGVSVANDTLITWNDPTDAYSQVVGTNLQLTYLQHLTNTWGASTNGGVQFYCMDNEHSIWHSTHQDIHPVGATMQEVLGKIITYASLVKSVDPQALVLGPEEWGWNGYLYSGYDQQWSGQNGNYNPADYPDRSSNGGWDYCPWLLNQLHQHDTNTGQRLLDYFTLHCYPQENNVGGDDVSTATELLRNQSTRQFWDPNYVDPSWINSVIDLIPRMKSWVAAYYPGTKVGVTEYNWGAEAYINGATAQADILGIFGRQGLDLATRWTVPAAGTPTYLAMKMYRNYDGQRSTFGDTTVLAGGPDPDNVAVFAAQRSADEALTVMVVCKYLTGTTPLAINVTNFTGAGTAQVWQLNSSNVIAQLPDLNYSAGALQTIVPSPSVTLFVIPPSSVLRFTSGAPRSDGQFEFWVNGEIGRSFILQSSTDLAHWIPAGTNTLAGASAHFLLPGGARTQFYRAALSR